VCEWYGFRKFGDKNLEQQINIELCEKIAKSAGEKLSLSTLI
jgi:hypothetical protein